MAYDRHSEEMKGAPRKIVIETCYNDCPYATDKHRGGCIFYFTCSLLDKEIFLNDNLIHFGVHKDCPLQELTGE